MEICKIETKDESKDNNFKKTDVTFSVSPCGKVETLYCYFGNVIIYENHADIPYIPEIFTGDFTEYMVLRKLRPNLSKSPGTDDRWHPYILRDLANERSNPLSILFQKSLKDRIAPTEEWTTSMHKKGATNILSKCPL